jgi:predicted AlkP superfamily pyrophosphatase or phosphodiesterase
MTHMLPTGFGNDGSLTDVLASCLSAVGVSGAENRLGIPAASSLILVVVDGLGAQNLERARGHARFLNDSRHSARVIRTVFPSTTAAALTSLMTGEPPLRHGIVGYRIRDPHSGAVFNQLNELEKAPSDWMRVPTLARQFESAADVLIVGRSKFEKSALSDVIYDGARYVPAESLDERFAVANKLALQHGRVVVVYVSELDSLAHKHGVESSAWSDALEALDGATKRAHIGLAESVRIIITADHGVVDVHSASHTVFTDPQLTKNVVEIGGEPRCLQLYVSNESHVPGLVHRWREYVEDRAEVLTRDAAIAQELFGPAEGLDETVLSRTGDLIILATGNTVFYDGAAVNKAPQKMIGQHGALSDAEMCIPLIVLE